MNEELLRVIHDEAHRFGISRLGAMMGLSERMLYNKLNPHADQHALTTAQLMQLICITGSQQIMAAMARAAGMSAHFTHKECPVDLVTGVIRASKESGDVMAVFAEKSADGVWTLSDAQRLEREANEAIDAIGTAVAASFDLAKSGGRLRRVA